MNDNKKTIECDPLGTPQVLDENKRWLIGHKIDNINNYDINYDSFFNFEKECNDEKNYLDCCGNHRNASRQSRH